MPHSKKAVKNRGGIIQFPERYFLTGNLLHANDSLRTAYHESAFHPYPES